MHVLYVGDRVEGNITWNGQIFHTTGTVTAVHPELMVRDDGARHSNPMIWGSARKVSND